MKKKLLSVLLAGTMVASVAAVGVVSASAEDGELAPGGFGSLGEYTPSAGVQTNKLMFAMPAAWQNDTTKNEKCGGAAGIWWWTGYDTPGNAGGAWPGWKTTKVVEEGVDNLWAIDVPTYGNGQDGDATMLDWNNYIDGGMEPDDTKNPFYKAAAQTHDFPCQYYSRTDEHETYDILFRYIYKKVLVQEGVEGAEAVDLNSETFWVDMNKAAAAAQGADWDSLSNDEKTFQVDNILDGATVDLSEFGAYAGNFFNEDLVGDEIYPKEESMGFGESFVFDNMVFVVSFDPEKMAVSPVSGMIGYDGDFYFYYGGGEYGSWPTKELNEQYGGVSGNFTQGKYVDPDYVPEKPTVDPTNGTVPPAATDPSSSTSDSPNGSNSSNNSNGAIATGQFSFAIIVLVIMFAGAGVIFFARKREHE